ncbi:hypothetical protein HOE04_00760 [archaeon]|jgi:hypothetical protein|nr:hypothetical protein [archaeon]
MSKKTIEILLSLILLTALLIGTVLVLSVDTTADKKTIKPLEKQNTEQTNIIQQGATYNQINYPCIKQVKTIPCFKIIEQTKSKGKNNYLENQKTICYKKEELPQTRSDGQYKEIIQEKTKCYREEIKGCTKTLIEISCFEKIPQTTSPGQYHPENSVRSACFN